jgi:hypothetical protein
MTLSPVVDGQLWHARQTLRFGPVRLATRMTVVRLAHGGLWVHSPIAPEPGLIAALARLGEVTDVVAPNLSHHLFFRAFIDACPKARGWVAPGLGRKCPELAAYPALRGDEPWTGALQPFFIRGLPLLDETVWFHAASGSLIVTDLLFCIGPNPNPLAGLLARLLGIHRRLGMSRTMRMMVRDKAAFGASVRPLLSLPVQRIILAHDQIVSDDARGALLRAFAFLGDAPGSRSGRAGHMEERT